MTTQFLSVRNSDTNSNDPKASLARTRRETSPLGDQTMMKLITICLAIFGTTLALSATTSAQVVTVTTRYIEDFNGNPVGAPSTSCPNPTMQPLVNGWTNVQGELPRDNEWTPDNGGTPSFSTGPSVDADGSPTGIYLYTETSGNCSGGDVAVVESPVFDVSGLALPSFSCSYHMFGLDQGELHFDLINVTSGTTTMDVIPPFIGNMGDVWRDLDRVPLLPLLDAPTDQFRIAIRAVSGPNFESDTAIDNFVIDNIPNVDVAVVSIDSFDDLVPAGVPQAVNVTVRNLGMTPASSIPIIFTVNGANPVAQQLVGPLAPGATQSFTFTSGAVFPVGPGTLTVQTNLAFDEARANDAESVPVTALFQVSSFPYLEDFESGDGGYTSSGLDSTWEFGTPNGTVIPAAASGTNAWCTNLDGDYDVDEFSTLTSPVFDCTTLVRPEISFSLHYDFAGSGSSPVLFGGGFDAGVGFMEISFDGVNFAEFGSPFSGVNWYDQNFFAWSGNSGGIITARHTLEGAAGQPFVQVRWVMSSESLAVAEGFMIDDVAVGELVEGLGQAPQAGAATLDVNSATEASGYGVGSDLVNGPYFTSIPSGIEYDLVITGEALQPVVVLAGPLLVGALPAPPAGQLDIDLAALQIVGNGTGSSLLDSLFVTNAAGQLPFLLNATPGFSGTTVTLQAAVFNSATGVAFSNAVMLTFL